MRIRPLPAPAIAASLLVVTAVGAASPPSPATVARPATPPARIAWFGTWEAGLAEAKRTGRPILLIAAAPHCHNISGMW